MLFVLLLFFSYSDTLGVDKPVFNSDSAWQYLVKQCSFGARNPGSKGAENCLKYFESELRKYTETVSLQGFTFYDARLKTNYNMTNVISDFGPSNGKKIILCAHWDTRPRAEHSKNPADRNKPIIGANDGASGVAVLLELARLFKANPPPVPVQIVLFDGEDYGRESEIWDYLLGSKHFAQSVDPSDYEYAVLLDMIGDADLEIKREYNSYYNCRELQDKIWDIAKKIGAGQFTSRVSFPITDDHLSLIEIGIPAVDLIDFEYKYWHTIEDTPDKCSKSSLEAVGRVLVELIYGESD